MIRIRTLGECLVELDGTPIRPEATLVFAILLYLGAERGKRVEREVLCALLWPRSTAARRKHNLRQILYKLNRAGLSVGGTSGPLSMSASDVWLDFEDAPTGEGGKDSREWWDTGVGPALPGYAPKFSPAFRSWLDELRARVESSARRRIVAALGRARRAAAWEEVERLARRCLQFDPLNEEATLALAEATALTGSKSRAIAMLDAYVAELGPAAAAAARVPAEVLRRRISDRIPRRVRGPIDVPLIGRDEDMRELAELIARTRTGDPGCCLVYGPPGIGKTRLIQEMGSAASLGATVVVTQRAAPDDVNTPGLTLTRLFRAMMAQPGSMGLAPDVLAFLKRLTAQGPLPADAPPPDSSEDALVRAMVDLQRALAWETTLVLVLDDAHHADALTRTTLNRAQGCLSDERVLLVMTALDEGSALSMTTARRSIRRLDTSASERLARLLFDHRGVDADADMVSALAAASGGNPFVLREAVMAMAGRSDGGIPDGSIEAILQQRCGELTDSARELLLTALILGEHASVAMLLSGTTLPADVAERALVELEGSQILACEARGGVHVHGLWLRSVEVLFPAGQIAARRLRVAQLLASASTNRADAAELLLSSAEQFQRAGDAESASTALAKGGAALKDRSLGSAAHSAYSRAVDLAPTSGDMGALIMHTIAAADQAHLLTEAEALCTAFAEHLDHSEELTATDRTELAVVHLRLREFATNGDPAVALQCVELLKSPTLSPQQALRAALLGAQVAEHNADVEIVRHIVSLAERIPDTANTSVVRMRRDLGIVHAVVEGRLEAARSIAEQAAVDLEPFAAPERARILLNARIPAWFDCDFQFVDRLLRQAMREFGTYPSTAQAFWITDAWATHCIDLMNLEDADAALQRARALGEKLGLPAPMLSFEEASARLAIARGGDAHTGPREPTQPTRSGVPRFGRARVFALSNEILASARLGDSMRTQASARELRPLAMRLADACPFDYPFAALAAGVSIVSGAAAARREWREYNTKLRRARHGPPPFVMALVAEFKLAT